MNTTEPGVLLAMSLIKGIARARPGELAESCGKALSAFASPLAIRVDIRIDGLDPETFESGKGSSIVRIRQAIDEYQLGNFNEGKRFPDYLSVTTEDDRLLYIALIKHLGEPVGLVAALADFDQSALFPMEESLYFAASQLAVRIQSILSPGSRNAGEITGRRLLRKLASSGVTGIALYSIGDPGDFTAINSIEDKIRRRSVELSEPPDPEKIKKDDALDSSMIDLLWPDSGIESAYWTADLPGYIMGIAFAGKRTPSRQTRTAIKSVIEETAVADTDYIIKSFEKLKADFANLVKSERAAAISETAVAVNHEINNPLTAILGNTQLMLMNESELPKDVVTKLKTIERSAVQIRETTGKLMAIVEPVRTPYGSGLNMIDIERSKKKEE